MPLGMKVDLGSGHIVLDGDETPHERAQQPPAFGHRLLWPNGWMDQDATWYKGGPQPRPNCVRLERCSPSKNVAQPFPIFGSYLLWPSG